MGPFFVELIFHNGRTYLKKRPIEHNDVEQEMDLFTFSYTCNGRESIDFGSKFQKGKFNGFTRYEVI